MVALKSPMMGIELNEEAAAYVGVLERQVVGLTINEMKYRALLEMLTGEAWDDLKHDLEEGELESIAIAAVEKKLQVSNGQARRIVRERKEALAAEQ